MEKIEMLLSNSCISADSITPIVRTMSSTATSTAAAASSKKYRTYSIRSWHEYQKIAPSHLHSINHYNSSCEEYVKHCEDHVMVLRENVTKITGWHWCTGWPAQNCADHDGYVDIRTGKKYTLQGENSFFKEIGI
jgi:hypothetical protein